MDEDNLLLGVNNILFILKIEFVLVLFGSEWSVEALKSS